MMRVMAMGLLMVGLLAGCASPYQSHGLGGGYDDIALAPNIYRVSFRGNGYTSMERAKDYALLRAAEVTLSNGYRFFIVTTDESYAKKMSVYIPGETKTNYSGTATGNVYRNGSFNANIYGNSTTYTTPGYKFDITKPKAVFMVVAFKDEASAPRDAFDAIFLQKSVRGKYNINNDSLPSRQQSFKSTDEDVKNKKYSSNGSIEKGNTAPAKEYANEADRQDANSRMRISKQLSSLCGKDVDWRQYSLRQLNEMWIGDKCE